MTTRREVAAQHGEFAFVWPVSTTGYCWTDNLEYYPRQKDPRDGDPLLESLYGSQVGPWLTHAAEWGVRRERYYEPLREPNLHRSLAAVTTDQKGILAFANRFGMLTGGVYLWDPEHPDNKRSARRNELHPRKRHWGEPLAFWQRELEHLRDLVSLWDAVHAKRVEKLRWHLNWPVGVGDLTLTWGSIRESIGPVNDRGQDGRVFNLGAGGEELPPWTGDDAIEQARYFVFLLLNRRLWHHVSPRVFSGKGEILFLPDCLLSGIYTHFMYEVSGRRRPARLCAGCGAYFIPAHGKQRFHDARCRKRAWYHRSKAKQGAGYE